MSHSHAAVGHALIQCKRREGSRMSTELPYNGIDHISQAFSVLSTGVSYRTAVARYIFNQITKQHELWVSPQYYSTSTQRHLGYFRAGFMAKHSSDNIFVTPAAINVSARSNPIYAKAILSQVNNDMPDIDKPRLREATRRGTIASMIRRLDVAHRNMTKGVPLDHIDADTLYDLQGTTHFLEMLLDTPDIDTVRAAVKAHIALNNPQNA